jgi:hypothetical protein
MDSMPRHRDVDIACRDALRRQHDGLQARSADFIDRERGDVIGEPAVEGGLARGILAEARGYDVAHDALVHDRGIDARAADGFGHDERAELRRREVLQRAEEFSGRRPDGARDDHVSHFREFLAPGSLGSTFRVPRLGARSDVGALT